MSGLKKLLSAISPANLMIRLVERPPRLFRLTVPGGLFRVKTEEKKVFITFDDGPVPEATPMVLDILDHFGIKATFFMVGQNAERYPHLVEEVLKRGHKCGNHTLHHLNGSKVTTGRYINDVLEADNILQTPLFRPPHGWLRCSQAMRLKRRFKIVMYDVVTRDYSRKVDADRVTSTIRRLARPGSIIVFHDSGKSLHLLPDALEHSLQWLKDKGYSFGVIE